MRKAASWSWNHCHTLLTRRRMAVSIAWKRWKRLWIKRSRASIPCLNCRTILNIDKVSRNPRVNRFFIIIIIIIIITIETAKLGTCSTYHHFPHVQAYPYGPVSLNFCSLPTLPLPWAPPIHEGALHQRDEPLLDAWEMASLL